MRCVEVDVQRMRSNNAGECSLSQIEVAYKVLGTKCEVFLFFKWEW
jgi:hypothetical protein